MRHKLLFLFVFVLLLPISSSAQDYYADIEIDIDNSGMVAVDGKTNYQGLTGEFDNLTSKDKGIWTFELILDDVFSHAVYRIDLPEGSTVNYMRMPNFGRIEHSEDGISIIGTAENQNLNILIQYSYHKVPKNVGNLLFVISAMVSIIFIFLVIYLFFFRNNKPLKGFIKNVKEIDGTASPSNADFFLDRSNLSDRQRLIVSLIEKKGGQVNQSLLEKELDMPKSSLSRNVDSLVRKGILQKKTLGVSNRLSIKKSEDD